MSKLACKLAHCMEKSTTAYFTIDYITAVKQFMALAPAANVMKIYCRNSSKAVSLNIYVHLFVSLPVYPSICLLIHLSVCLYFPLFVYLSIHLSVCLSIHLSICLSSCLSICLSFCLSICPFAFLSVLLSICFFLFANQSIIHYSSYL
jgi:hypothetical protein